MKKLRFGSPLLILLLIFLAAIGCSPRTTQDLSGITNVYNSAGTNLICFGDSLTTGVGSLKGTNFPAILASKLDMQVINAGRSGDTTYSALERLERDVLDKDPKIVIVEFGGNDYLLWSDEGHPKYGLGKTFENLELMIDRIHETGATVVLAAIPLSRKYRKKFENVAREKRVLFIPDIMKGIYGNRDRISLDRVHPNDEGYEVMAQTILEYIQPLITIKR
jgi:acyl-CoA thioesterase-1